MSIQMILLDLDGTLLTSDKRLSPGNRAALERAAARGVHIVPSTGRFYSGMPQVGRELPFVRYVVSINGALIYDAAEDKVLRRADIAPEDADRLFQRMEQLPVLYDCFIDGWGCMDRRQYEQVESFVEDPGFRRMILELRRPVDDLRGYVVRTGTPVQKTQMFFREAAARNAELERMIRDFPDMSVTSSYPLNIEINAKPASKGEGLRFLCRHLGIDPRDAMACGDGSNDISMLQAAGVGVAMANADPRLLAAADYVTGGNDSDGVAEAVERFCF